MELFASYKGFWLTMHKVGLNEMLDFNQTNSELEYVEMDSSKRYGRVSFSYHLWLLCT